MRRVRPWHLLLATWFVVIVYSFPGYMNWDSGDQLHQARTGYLTDWYPPMMAFLWRRMESVFAGPFGMLAVQTGLFVWGVNALLSTRLAPRTAAIVTMAIVLFPPILTPMAVVWKDAQMAGYLVAGVALAMRPGRRARVLGLVLIFLGVSVRDNAAAALPPLCLLITAAWTFRRRWIAFAAAVGLCIGLFGAAMIANKAVTTEGIHPWYRTIALHDIAGVICHAGPMSDAELTELLAGTQHHDVATGIQDRICAHYTPRIWWTQTQGEGSYWEDITTPEIFAARWRAWKRLVSDHPIAYLEHRTEVMAQVLGLTADEVWEPVCQTVEPNPNWSGVLHHDFQLSRWQRRMGQLFRAIGQTIIYRAWAYALLSLLFLGYGLVKRDRFVWAIAGSGLLYEASYFFGAPAPDWRYSHWMALCCLIAAVTIFADRWRAGRARRSGEPVGAVV